MLAAASHVAQRPQHPAAPAQLEHVVPRPRRFREQVRAPRADLAGGVHGQRPLVAVVVIALVGAAGGAVGQGAQLTGAGELVDRDRAPGPGDQPDVRMIDHDQVVAAGEVLHRGHPELLQRFWVPSGPGRRRR